MEGPRLASRRRLALTAAAGGADSALAWLVRLRWAAVGGQASTILAAQWLFGAALPLGALGLLLALEALSNAALEGWRRRARGAAARVLDAPWVVGSIMLLDMTLLMALLYTAGGPQNPFGIFVLVNVVLGAVLLEPRWAWALLGVAFAGYGALHGAHRPVDALGLLPPIYARGRLVALAGAAIIIVYFVTRVRAALARREAELRRAREREERSARLQALATLAAGAAHELKTPLSTIAVVARELEHALEGAGLEEAEGDARLIREEVARCRAILDRMATEAGARAGEGLELVEVEALIEEALDGAGAPLGAAGGAAPAGGAGGPGGSARLRVEVAPEVAQAALFLPRQALAQSLRAILQNALDASPPDTEVEVRAARAADAIAITVVDHGRGMAPDELARAGDPFFTTKEVGRGMGLGLYLARAVIEQVGGRLALASTPGAGTRATVELPLAR